jgi:hypothetical protein
LVLAGVLIGFVPYLTVGRQAVTAVPAPPALRKVSPVALAPGQQACMSSIAIPQQSRLARFRVSPSSGAGAPLELILRGSGYEARTRRTSGYAAGGVTLPIPAPQHDIVGTACFVNRGTQTAVLAGTSEPRTTSRSATRLDGRLIGGDIALELLDNRRPSLLDRTADVFDRASNLTDHLVPAWLIWLLVVLVALGVPTCTMAAVYLALREDEAAPAS